MPPTGSGLKRDPNSRAPSSGRPSGSKGWVVLGIDLAGREGRPTGAAVLTPDSLACLTVFTDGEILELASSRGPDLVAVDAPLSRPTTGWLRESDRELIRRGLRVLPPLLGPMRLLTERGLRLAEVMRSRGLRVVEVHPGSTAKILGVPRTPEGVLAALEIAGISAEPPEGGIRNVHEVDAALAAVTGALLLEGRAEVVGGREGIAIPRLDAA